MACNCTAFKCAHTEPAPTYDFGRRYDDRSEYIADTMRAILDELTALKKEIRGLNCAHVYTTTTFGPNTCMKCEGVQ